VIALELDRGRPDAAFAYLERERAAAWVRRDTRGSAAPRAAALGITDVRRRLSPGTLVLEYALLPDRLVIWAVRRDTVGWFAVPVGRDSVARLVARFGDEAAFPDATGARAALFDLLIRPVAGDVAGAAQLVAVPDRELSRLPLAALWDRDARAYLVERHAVRTLPSAAFVTGARSLGLVSRDAPTALVVGDPTTDRAALPQLAPLPGAAREAARVAAIYPGARVLSGRAARVDSLLALLPGHRIFHFAGHAIVNAEQPELSYLALAADGAGNGTLLAREIGRLRLSDVKIAVLSACSTLGPRDTHVGAIAGLAYSFMRAGTPAIVSSLWDIDDSASAALLVTFHRHLAAGDPAPDALRAAQLEALRSGQAALRAPRAWAAFVYTGP